MKRVLPLACLSLALTAAPAMAETAPNDAVPRASVEEILKHLETFMPEPSQAMPALYVLGPRTDAINQPARAIDDTPAVAPPRPDATPEQADGGNTAEPQGQKAVAPVPEATIEPGNEGDEAGQGKEADEGEEVPTSADEDLEARLGAIDFGALSRDVQILPMIGKDMAELDAGFRASALHDMARRAMDSQQPAAFRKIMAAYVDPQWQDLTDAETALNIIAWMPDTAAFLGARISAARFVGSQDALSHEDQAFLWKDLRARVIRVGREDYTQDMLCGMIETGHVDLAIETVKRSTASDHERMAAYLRLIEADGARMKPDALAALSAQVDALRGELQATRYDPNAVALAYWRSGLTDQAVEALAEETDPALRLRTHFEMLLETK